MNIISNNNVILILWVIALVGIVVFGAIKKNNIGIWGIAISFILACVLGKTSVSTLMSYLPYKTVYLFMSTALFFGYANSNGTMNGVASRIVYASRNYPWAYPLCFYGLGLVLTAIGCGATAAIIISATIGFAIATKANINPLLVPIGIICGTTFGSSLPTNVVFGSRKAYLTPFFDEDILNTLAVNSLIFSILLTITFFLIVYFYLKGYKAKKIEDIEKPQPFNKNQKKTLIVLLIVCALVLIPQITKLLLPKSVFIKNLASLCDIQMLSFLGSITCFLMKLGDEKDVVRRVPWGIVVMTLGMTTFLTVGLNAGLTDAIMNILPSNLSPRIYMAILFCIGGVLSFFTGAFTVWNIVLPVGAAVLAARPDAVNPSMVAISCTVGAFFTGMSPFSTAGAAALTACPDSLRDKVFLPQFFTVIIGMIYGALLCLTPLGGSIFPL